MAMFLIFIILFRGRKLHLFNGVAKKNRPHY